MDEGTPLAGDEKLRTACRCDNNADLNQKHVIRSSHASQTCILSFRGEYSSHGADYA